MLAYLYPGQMASFAAALASALAGIADGAAKGDAIALGRAIADDIIALRKGDGFDDFVDFTGSTAPGQWQASAPIYAVALLPQWADLQPFAMSSPSEFRPPAPPALDSATYTADFAEVKTLGSATGSTRSAEQTEIARFWADGAGTDTPPGHWNRIAATLATAQGNSLAANARLFAQLNVALADASIAAWDAKYHYTAWRPITAIRAADTDGNDATAADAAWTSLLITPPFPEYVSGHSTYSGAAEAVLASAFGTSTAFTIDSEGLPGIERSFANVHAAAEEAGRSRIYGGIHFEFANQAGLVAGRALGQKVLDTFASHTDTQAPRLLLEQADGLVSGSNVTLSGRVLDALSGVAVLQGAFDDAAPGAIAFDADGRFSMTSALALDGSADGVHTLTLSAVDARGNVSAPLSLRFTLDTRAPEMVLSSLAEGDALSTASRLAGTADPTGSTLVSLTYAFDGGRAIPVAFDPASGDFDSALDLSALAVGAHTLTLTALDAAGHTAVSTLALTLPELIPLTITRTTPSNGADDVGATFKPQVVFSRSVDVTTLTSSTFYATDTTGAKLAATIVPAADGSFAWLFLTNPLPGASTITLHVVGDGILAGDGQALDADGDGTPGGTFTSRFTTVSVTPIAGTTISGRLLDPGDDLKPMTFDDIRAGADGALHTADDVFLHPIAGAKVFILGLEGNVVYTDANGYFHLDQVPAGDVKLAIDGRTASNAPAGSFYPEMVMDLTVEVGYDNTVMGSMGTREAMAANEERQEVYLPRLQTAILQSVSGTEATEVGVDAVSAPNLTDEQRAHLKLEVQPGMLIGADGKVMSGGQVGISTVPPELVRDMLPPGVLQHTFDITIQAPGVAAFATPLEITFPNVFEAAPGTKLNFLSFDHTTGRLVIEGTATVSADGKSVTTDPGQGITKPGWHGLTPAGFVYTLDYGQPCVDPTDRLKNLLHAVPKAFGAVFSVAADGLSVASGLVTSQALSVASSIASWATTLATNAFGVNFGTGSAITGTYSAVAKDGAPGKQLASNASAALAVLDTASQIEQVQRLIKEARDLVPCENVVGEDPATIADRASAAAGDLLAKARSQAPLFAQLRTTADDIYQLTKLAEPALPQFGYSPSQQAQLLALMNSYVAVANEILHQGPFFVSLVRFFNSVSAFITKFASCETYYGSAGGGGGGGGGGSGGGSASRVYPTHYWTAEMGDAVLRGSMPANQPVSFFAAPDKLVRLTVFEPTTNRYGTIIFTTGPSGNSVSICGLPLVKGDTLTDDDHDGLPDLGELAIGTSPAKSDTDADGIGDLVEVMSSLDPLGGRALPTGIVSTLPLQGQAKAVTLEGSTTNAEMQTAYVATGTHGLAIVDASNFQRPLVLSQLDLTGDAVDIAVDSRLGIAAVAAGSALHLVDVSDATAPVRTQTINIPAVQVEVANGVAYVAAGNGIESYSLLTGEL
ncbi:Ig-like domain-containing protein, partial [Accumulibacter sp.]|uniref:Ig-like domain-containing protein n=1 Tax=Accumulibacter sp. TaxID=2053492 RepID=UPI0025C02C2F